MGVIQFLDDSSRVYALLSSSSLEVNEFEWMSSSFWMIVVGFLPYSHPVLWRSMNLNGCHPVFG